MIEINLPLAPFGVRNGQVNKANPTQQRVLEWVRNIRASYPLNYTPVLYLQGGVGSGKTRAFLAACAEILTEIPGIKVLWGRYNLKDLELSVKDRFFEVIVPELIADKDGQYNFYDVYTDKEGSSRIFFNGLMDINGLGSQEYAVIIVTEAHEITEYIYRALKRRCRQEGMPCMILLESEAPNDDHWLSKLTNPHDESYDPDITKWELSTYENWENLPLSYRGSLESMPEAWKKKYLYGHTGFIPDGKPYYMGYKEHLHTGEFEWNSEKELLCGWDFGFHHPACLITQIDMQDRWIWLREIIGNDITIDKFAEQVKQVINLYYPNATCIHFGDPACVQKNDKSEFTSWQILFAKGISLQYRQSEYRLRKEIIESKLSRLIGDKPSLLVDKRYCKTVNDGFLGGYHYPLRKEGQQFIGKFELPFKDGFYEHIMNSGEYIAVNLFSPIETKEERQSDEPAESMSNI